VLRDAADGLQLRALGALQQAQRRVREPALPRAALGRQPSELMRSARADDASGLQQAGLLRVVAGLCVRAVAVSVFNQMVTTGVRGGQRDDKQPATPELLPPAALLSQANGQ